MVIYSYSLFLFLFILLDQASKLAVLKFFSEIVVLNTRGVFGIFPWWGFVLGMLGVLWILWKKRTILAGVQGLSFVLIFAGGISNIIDRVLWGGVVDFIKIWRFPVFNIADVFISVGTIIGVVRLKR